MAQPPPRPSRPPATGTPEPVILDTTDGLDVPNGEGSPVPLRPNRKKTKRTAPPPPPPAYAGNRMVAKSNAVTNDVSDDC